MQPIFFGTFAARSIFDKIGKLGSDQCGAAGSLHTCQCHTSSVEHHRHRSVDDREAAFAPGTIGFVSDECDRLSVANVEFRSFYHGSAVASRISHANNLTHAAFLNKFRLEVRCYRPTARLFAVMKNT
jgi:hypothetical protein